MIGDKRKKDKPHRSARGSGGAAAVLLASMLVLTSFLCVSIIVANAAPATITLRSNEVMTSLHIFTTNTTSPTTVNLGSAADYAVLAESGITTTGATSITGDIAVSPIASNAITGFSLTPDGSGQFSTSPLVTGRVYAADYASPTPAVLGTAVGDMQAAYTDAMGRVPANFINLGAGNIGGLTLVPGIYKWTSDVTISSDITLLGGPTDVWIFQISGTLTVSSGVQAILSGGAQPNNIFWTVAEQTTIGAAAVFNGNILAQTGITMNSGATLNGRALAQTAVTLIADSINKPASPFAPMAFSTVPVNGATGVPVNITLAATFSKAMNPATINTATFLVFQEATPVAGTVTYSGVTATFTPTSPLLAGTTYTATITAEATDTDGNPLVRSYTWFFTTT